MKFTLLFFGVAFILLTTSEFALAQQTLDEPRIVPSKSSGEVTAAMLDALAVQASGSGERLFVIVRLGSSEKSRGLNFVRLYNTRQYISGLRYSFGQGFSSKPTVFAEGERVEGEGRIEFYLGCRLELVVLAPQNKMPNLTCCDDDYVPPVKRKPKRKNRKS